MIGLTPTAVREVAVLGAHCDDIAMGIGGTLLTLAARYPGLRVRAIVLSGADTPRETEESHALRALCPQADLELSVLDIPDGRAPGYWEYVKLALQSFRNRCEPDIVFAPQRADEHQDHRLVAELTPTVFRDQLVLGYEILKWEADTPRTAVYYPSQADHDWFDEEAFLALSRLRGVQCRHPHAEAFVIEKAIVRFGGV